MTRIKLLASKTFLTITLGMSSLACQAISLYSEERFKTLTADNRASKIGDIVTVQVFENASAQSTADTGSRRNAGAKAELNRVDQSSVQVGLSAGGDFDGGGRTTRTNRLLATISVKVVDVLQNGDLQIAGEQQLTLNDEVQSVKLEGRIRQGDLSDENMVLSSRIADAKISYAGQGELTDRQRKGWWKRLLDAVGF